ncbi:DUF2163 domain-containing protein [Variovorax sp. PAMC 28711]|uniref:DUF2163 domain-containing protein n=1 Tax=Variovorax sp. PAMC 28711 TaxID=1795631 RepID=UPI00078CC4CC|nr:DUF2163 domain-containing protein [Variovorax sp. PAMC 28711]AMM23160.1 hypothetical protein AX767_01315 [Variovorax sp. PAMC 28711]
MKTRSIALAAAQAAGSTTLARCWRFTRTDGEIVTVTTCAKDLLVNGELYVSRLGVTPTALEQQVGAAVPNSEIDGTLNTDFATEADILGGLWDGAQVFIFEVNYRDLSQGWMILQTGTLGDVSVGRSSFKAEVRGLAQALQQVVGEVYTQTCTANLGDARCKVNVEAMRVAGTVAVVTSRQAFTTTTTGYAADYFGAGVITWVTGANAGFSMEVNSYTSPAFALNLPMPFNVAAGDTYTVIPGCRKRVIEDCKTKFANILNFRGFPYVPGPDKVLGLGGTEGSNL